MGEPALDFARAHRQHCGVLPDSGSHPISVAALELRTHIGPFADKPRLGVGFGLQLASLRALQLAASTTTTPTHWRAQVLAN